MASKQNLTKQGTENERAHCSCPGQCAWKRGRGACPCKAADLNCVDGCKCVKSKCKNQISARPCYSRRGHLVTQDTGSSGRHSPVGGIAIHPDENQEEAENLVELLLFLFLLTK
ncbi:uncharacterized protein LOC110042820 isoform X5 [Orbicella faveolata]|uniref:uncharacterized protein LOC110042820 isoform X5 n=1 Tax=Orbicella faveolata TaxID=48498 RepID=UPI0009E55E9A|nr:uncharacterized protein LOC110042820 isoform X5 [Orbicella faveolata]